jgi:hypothetical protein
MNHEIITVSERSQSKWYISYDYIYNKSYNRKISRDTSLVGTGSDGSDY